MKQLKQVKAYARLGNCKFVALCDYMNLIWFRFNKDCTVVCVAIVDKEDFRKALPDSLSLRRQIWSKLGIKIGKRSFYYLQSISATEHYESQIILEACCRCKEPLVKFGCYFTARFSFFFSPTLADFCHMELSKSGGPREVQ